MIKNLLLSLMLFTPIPTLAQATNAPLGPERIVHEGIGHLTAHLRSAQDLASPQVRAFLQNKIAPYFDFAYMARSASGPWYRRISTVQRTRLENRIKKMFISTMAANLATYKGQNIRIFPGRYHRSGKAIVKVILLQQGTPIRLDFRFYYTPNNAWKVYDVIANGNSATMHYRTYTQKMVRRHGPRWFNR